MKGTNMNNTLTVTVTPGRDTKKITQQPKVTVCDCGHEPSNHSKFTTGYGRDNDGKTYCFACCAKRDIEQMTRDGKTILYLTFTGNGALTCAGKLTNWPGSLSFNARVRVGRHNIAGKRYDAWFLGPDGATWHGVQYGDNTQICHCKRIKR